MKIKPRRKIRNGLHCRPPALSTLALANNKRRSSLGHDGRNRDPIAKSNGTCWTSFEDRDESAIHDQSGNEHDSGASTSPIEALDSEGKWSSIDTTDAVTYHKESVTGKRTEKQTSLLSQDLRTRRAGNGLEGETTAGGRVASRKDSYDLPQGCEECVKANHGRFEGLKECLRCNDLFAGLKNDQESCRLARPYRKCTEEWAAPQYEFS